MEHTFDSKENAVLTFQAFNLVCLGIFSSYFMVISCFSIASIIKLIHYYYTKDSSRCLFFFGGGEAPDGGSLTLKQAGNR